MDKQLVFDTVLQHLRTQGSAAANADGCSYRDYETGHMCAVGCLIPNADYRLSMEGDNVYQLRSRHPETRVLHYKLYELSDNELGMLNELQSAHDVPLYSHGVSAWETYMQNIAGVYGLTYNPPEQAA